MSKWKKYSLLAVICLLTGGVFQSCEQDVNLFAPPKFTPVIYCLLNPQDSVQTVRVSRVFQDRDDLLFWEKTFDNYLKDLTGLFCQTSTESWRLILNSLNIS